MPESKLSTFLEVAPRVVGTLAALIYGSGFLVVALYLAQFGVSEFNFLRSQVFLSGTLFVFLTAIPAYGVLHLFGRIGPKGVSISGGRPIVHLTLYKLECAISFYMFSFASASCAIPLFPTIPFERLWGMWSSLALLIPLLTLAVLSHWFFDRYWFFFLSASLIVNGSLAIIVFLCFSRTFFWLTIWFYAVGIETLLLEYALRDPGVRGGLRWETVPLWLVSLITIYALAVYGGLKPQFGGGAPTPAVIYTTTKVPIFDSDSAKVLILQETEKGYYFSIEPNRKPAYFISRDLVSIVTFPERGKDSLPAWIESKP